MTRKASLALDLLEGERSLCAMSPWVQSAAWFFIRVPLIGSRVQKPDAQLQAERGGCWEASAARKRRFFLTLKKLSGARKAPSKIGQSCVKTSFTTKWFEVEKPLKAAPRRTEERGEEKTSMKVSAARQGISMLSPPSSLPPHQVV